MYNEISQLPLVQQSRQGKVRDIYDLGETLLIVSTDRISAFDVVFPTLIPDKGKILNAISVYFFQATSDIIPNHFILIPGVGAQGGSLDDVALANAA